MLLGLAVSVGLVGDLSERAELIRYLVKNDLRVSTQLLEESSEFCKKLGIEELSDAIRSVMTHSD
jgi:hypothetical protein